jgi:hypothetical protein
MDMTTTANKASQQQPGLSVGKMLAIVAAAMLVTMIATLLLIKLWLFPGPFSPVTLTPAEERGLQAKLARLEAVENGAAAKGNKGKEGADGEIAAPTPYSEENASREIVFSEKELNALIGKNPDLAGKAAIDLADNLVSATVLIPTNADVPLVGGRPIRVKVGLTLASQDGRPVVALRGVSVMGVPMPNAWLGKLKDIDLIKKYGADNGFWRFFADGIQSIQIQEGQAKIALKP